MNEEIVLEEEAIAEERSADAERFGAAILHKPICELSSLRPPLCLPPQATVRSAIDRMREHNIGCVLVEEGGRLVGIFTERDVLTRVAGTDLDLDATPLAALMTRAPQSLSAGDLLVYALNEMSIGGFRHIPLVDEAGRPIGVVAMRDVVDYIVELFRNDVLNLPPTPRHAMHARDGG